MDKQLPGDRGPLLNGLDPLLLRRALLEDRHPACGYGDDEQYRQHDEQQRGTASRTSHPATGTADRRTDHRSSP
jgi:hypothetical protein